MEPNNKKPPKSPRKVTKVNEGGMRIRSRSNLKSDQSKRTE